MTEPSGGRSHRCWKCKVPHAAGFDGGPRAAFAQYGLDHIAQRPGSWLVIPANHHSISATGINTLTSLFTQSDRHGEDQAGPETTRQRRRHQMKKFGFATIVASGLAAAVLGQPARARPTLSPPLGAGHPTAGHRRLDHSHLRQRPLTHTLTRKGRPHKGAPSSHGLPPATMLRGK